MPELQLKDVWWASVDDFKILYYMLILAIPFFAIFLLVFCYLGGLFSIVLLVVMLACTLFSVLAGLFLVKPIVQAIERLRFFSYYNCTIELLTTNVESVLSAMQYKYTKSVDTYRKDMILKHLDAYYVIENAFDIGLSYYPSENCIVQIIKYYPQTDISALTKFQDMMNSAMKK
jgi:hypothetical protein